MKPGDFYVRRRITDLTDPNMVSCLILANHGWNVLALFNGGECRVLQCEELAYFDFVQSLSLNDKLKL